MTLAEIRANVLAFLHRPDDTQLLAVFPALVSFAQSRILTRFQAQVAEQLATLAFVAGADGAEAPLPGDYMEGTAIAVTGADLRYMTPRQWARAGGGTSAQLEAFTTIGARVIVPGRYAGGSGSLVYFARAGELVADADSNYLSESFADLLTWATIAEAHRFVQDWEQASAADAEVLRLVQLHNSQQHAARYAGGSLRIGG